MTEFEIVVAQGPMHVDKLVAMVDDPTVTLLKPACLVLDVLIAQLRALGERVVKLDAEIVRRAKDDSTARRLMTIPGIGAITATALIALAPSATIFRRAVIFAAWLGLTPVQRSSGGKERLGRTSRIGEQTLRRLPIIGANVVASWALRMGTATGTWLVGMMSRKPPMPVRVALANKMAPDGVGTARLWRGLTELGP
ncbi:transposase [Bradyrhizobium sp. BR 1433]|uniref:transposase n=1 Tax=Bradyrhizobium sp. BR 1433 TaxID=3447967 RepID=UPI003EE55491